jgi:hypothetical protein
MLLLSGGGLLSLADSDTFCRDDRCESSICPEVLHAGLPQQHRAMRIGALHWTGAALVSSQGRLVLEGCRTLMHTGMLSVLLPFETRAGGVPNTPQNPQVVDWI